MELHNNLSAKILITDQLLGALAKPDEVRAFEVGTHLIAELGDGGLSFWEKRISP